MGLVTRFLGIQNSLEDPAQPLVPPSVLWESAGLGRSDAGVVVNEESAMRLATAFSCINITSSDLGCLGHEILQRMPDGETTRVAREHYLWKLIHDQPNPYMTAAIFWAVMQACVDGWGNGYALIRRDGAARPMGFWPLHPGRTAPVKVNGELLYATTQTQNGEPAKIDPANILHFKGLSIDGYVGLSPIGTCKNAFGLAIASEQYGARFFANGARATGVLTHPGILEDIPYQRLEKSVREWANGEKAFRPIILEDGMQWQQITIAPEEAQMLQTRQFQRAEIAGLYRVPLHLIGDLTRSTNNNIEHQSIDYSRYGLRPRAVRTEQEVNVKLLGGSFFMEHNFADLMRGDFASQTAGLQILRNTGIFSTDDSLRFLRLNPIGKAKGGDVRIVQSGFTNLLSLKDPNPAGNQPAAGDQGGGSAVDEGNEGNANPSDRFRPALLNSFTPLFSDALGRTRNRGGKDTEFIGRAFRPGVRAMVQAGVACRFGNSTLTQSEEHVIERLVAAIVAGYPAYGQGDADTVAADISGTIWDAIQKEILQ